MALRPQTTQQQSIVPWQKPAFTWGFFHAKKVRYYLKILVLKSKQKHTKQKVCFCLVCKDELPEANMIREETSHYSGKPR